MDTDRSVDIIDHGTIDDCDVSENNRVSKGCRSRRAMKASSWRRWLFRVLVASVLAVAMGYLPYQIYGPAGMAKAMRLQRDLNVLLESNEQLAEQNRALRQEIRSLKQDMSHVEQVARDELGMVRPGDIVFQFR